jgi:hypothetical protein
MIPYTNETSHTTPVLILVIIILSVVIVLIITIAVVLIIKVGIRVSVYVFLHFLLSFVDLFPFSLFPSLSLSLSPLKTAASEKTT